MPSTITLSVGEILAAAPLRNVTSETTIIVNLIEEPTGACSLAISLLEILKGAAVPEHYVQAQSVSNPDIAGIGILIAFLATAYGIFIWMIVAYFSCWLSPSLLGQADEYIFRRPARKRITPPWWQNAVNQGILGYADQQIVTGVAILAAAFNNMRTLSAYHLQVAIHLAWISSNTHLTAVSLLQTEFRETRMSPNARRLRIAGMALLALMLLVALIPTTGMNWDAILHDGGPTDIISSSGAPAWCFWHSEYSGGLAPDAAWSFIILIFSYLWKGMLLFKPSQRFLKVKCRERLQDPLKIFIDRVSAELIQDRRAHRMWLLVQYKLSLSLYLMVWTTFELAESFITSLWICGGGLVWGSIQILQVRQTTSVKLRAAENSWAFGQLLPVLLLAVPLVAFSEGLSVQKLERSGRNALEEETAAREGQDNLTDGHATGSLATTWELTPRNLDNANIPKGRLDSDMRNAEVRLLEEKAPALTISERTWKSDRIIYLSGFIQSLFWISQICFLCFFCLLTVFYFMVVVGTPFGLWLIVGLSFIGWVGVVVLLFIGGAIFSKLFEIDNNPF